jgi:hypothetical protein
MLWSRRISMPCSLQLAPIPMPDECIPHPSILFLLGPNTIRSTMFSCTLSRVRPLVLKRGITFHSARKRHIKLYFCMCNFCLFIQRTGWQNILHWMVARIHHIYYYHNFFVSVVWFDGVVPKCLNFTTLSKDLSTTFVFRHCSASCCRDMNV